MLLNPVPDFSFYLVAIPASCSKPVPMRRRSGVIGGRGCRRIVCRLCPCAMSEGDSAVVDGVRPAADGRAELRGGLVRADGVAGASGGAAVAQSFTACRVEWVKAGRALVLHLDDSVAQLTLSVHLELDRYDVLRVHNRLVNVGTDVLVVHWLAAGTVPYRGRRVRCVPMSGSGRTSSSCRPSRLPAAFGNARTGAGGPRTTPSPARWSCCRATEHTGMVYGAHLGWSGNRY